MNFDYLLIHYIGEFGTYQIIYFILVTIPTIFPALHSLSWTFTGASIPYRCLVIGETDTAEYPFEPKSREYGLWLRNVHHENDTPNDTRQSYTIKKIINTCARLDNFSITQQIIPSSLNEDVIEPCLDGYKWDTSEIKNTAIKRWEFVCNRQLLKAFVQSVYYIGQFFGSFIFGIFGDKFGRKRIFFLAIAIEILCGTAMAYIPWWPLFALFRFGLGFAHPGIFVTAVVIGELWNSLDQNIESCPA
uniref:Major facilitator superfamily (MFS) profile domain-containing protein n=1 Tax=Romanomermis culicivorax TaxID=13658 RepID=A0A915I844_ROMCU